MENPWKTLGSQEVYRNAWMRVREDRVIRPDGKEGIYGVVETRVATGVVALTPNNEIYLVGQYRYPTRRYSWEIVQGGADSGEDPLDAIKRELVEEAGLVAERWEQIGGEIHLSNCISSEIGYLYLAEGLSETQASPDGTEILKVRRLPIKDCIGMVESGEIQDAMSLLGIFYAERTLLARG